MKPRRAARSTWWSATITAARSMPWKDGCSACAASTEVEAVCVHLFQGAQRLEVGQAVVPRPDHREQPVMPAQAPQLVVGVPHQGGIGPARAPQPLQGGRARAIAREGGRNLEHELAFDARKSDDVASW